MSNIDKFITIVEKTTNRIIASGKVINEKMHYSDDNNLVKDFFAISFDNKLFFNLNSKKFLFKEEKTAKFLLDYNFINNTFVVVPWNNVPKISDADIYQEYDITELDPEVEKLVYVLNKFENMKTVTSCCGHATDPLEVDIQFFTFFPICLLAKIIYTKFKTDFILTTDSKNQNINLDRVLLKLKTTAIGKEAYKKANELVIELEKYLKMLNQGK